MRKYLIIAGIAAAILSTIYWQHQSIRNLKRDVATYKGNTEALLSDIEQYQVDSTTTATEVKGLQLTVDEYKKYRSDDIEQIKKLNVKVKDLEAVSTAKMRVYCQLISELEDTLIIRDSLLVEAKRVHINDGHVKFDALIENDTMTTEFDLDVTLKQVFFPTYKWKFLWWRGPIKDIKQIVTTDNPYVKLEYLEYIKLRH